MIIYKAENKINGMVYIGKTKRSLSIRKNEHKYSKIKNIYFSNAIFKYGYDNFEWTIIFKCINEQELNEMEKYFITNYRTTHNVYNLTDGGDGVSGCVWTEERKKKFGLIRKGKKRPDQSLRMRGENNPNFGKKHSQETKEFISKLNTGRKRSEENKRKTSIQFKQLWSTEEFRNKIATSRMMSKQKNKEVK